MRVGFDGLAFADPSIAGIAFEVDHQTLGNDTSPVTSNFVQVGVHGSDAGIVEVDRSDGVVAVLRDAPDGESIPISTA